MARTVAPDPTPVASPPGAPFAHVVRMGAALATAGAGFLHLDAAGDHTDHAVIAVFFVAVAVAQLAGAAALAARQSSNRTLLSVAALHGAVLVVWATSRTVNLDFVPGVEGVEALGWKDVAASGLELAALATMAVAAVMPAAAAAVVVPARFANRVVVAMAAATMALTVPGVLVAHDHAGHAHGDEAAHGHDAGPEGAVPVHAHGDEGHDHAPGEVITNPDGTPHLHGEVTTVAGPAGHDHGDGHGHAATTAAPVGHDHATAAVGAPVDHHHSTTGAPVDHGGHGDHGDHGAAHGAAHGAVHDTGPVAPDPLVGPGTVSTVRVGPIPLLPSIPGLDLSALHSPGLFLAAPGHVNLPLAGIPPPCTDCLVLGVQPDLVYLDGTSANLDTGPMLHHMVVFDTGRQDPICGRNTAVGAFGLRVFASGNERTGGALPEGFGLEVGNSLWAGLAEIMNVSTQPKVVFIELTARWVPRGTPGVQPVTPVWLDIDSCGDSAYDIGAGVSEQVWDWTSNMTGRIVAAGGHLHDGGSWLAAHNATTGEHVCTSVAGYGTIPAYMGALETMSYCVWDRLATVRAGEVIRLTAHYNTAAPARGVMGIMMIFVHETDDLLAGTPSPYPSVPPPDGQPLDGGHAH